MKKLRVNLGEKSYDIEIKRGLLEKIGTRVRSLSKASKVAVITDDNVDSLYGSICANSLEKEGFLVTRIVIKAGEKSKNLTVLTEVFAKMAEFGLTRSDLVLTLGGGVPGDLGGFAAASFLRGIDFMQIPTSLLAQIDSSVGGKVAVDLPSGKNLVGAFYQPKAVFIDPNLLRTLPVRFLHDGLAEAIKYGCIRSLELFEKIKALKSDEELLSNIDEIIYECVKIKAEIVERDEFDNGERMLLNYGHTLGHAIEKIFGFSEYTHGEGVGLGMLMLTEKTENEGITKSGSSEKIREILKQFKLPISIDKKGKTLVDKHDLLEIIKLDKKKRGEMINLVVLEEVGKSKILKVKLSELEEML